MPVGWSPNGAYASWTALIAVPATGSPGYYNGSGSDPITYRMPPAVAAQVKTVRVTLNYQSIPP